MQGDTHMKLGQIIDAVWSLPWYKILIIACADDLILLLKLWPLWVTVGLLILHSILFDS